MSESRFEVTHWPEEMHRLGLVDVGSYRASLTVECDANEERLSRMIAAYDERERFAVRIRLTPGVWQDAIAQVVEVKDQPGREKVTVKLECWWPGEERSLHPMAAILR